MVKNRRVVCWVTKKEYEEVLENSKRKGFSSLADYVRARALLTDIFIEESLVEIKKKLQKISELG